MYLLFEDGRQKCNKEKEILNRSLKQFEKKWEDLRQKQRVKDFKTVIIKYLESLVQTQQQLIKYWEAFLPEAKAIA
eukprot:bmy_09016T0